MRKKVLKKLTALTAAATMLMSGMTVFAEETYTTKTGDNLSKIAKQFYDDADKWKDIYESNKNQIKDPNKIWANQMLIIPDVGITQITDTEQAADTTQTTDTEQATQQQVANVTSDQNPQLIIQNSQTGEGYFLFTLEGEGSQLGVLNEYTDAATGEERYSQEMKMDTGAYGETYLYTDEYTDESYLSYYIDEAKASITKYMAENPDSALAKIITKNGNNFVWVIGNAFIPETSSEFAELVSSLEAGEDYSEYQVETYGLRGVWLPDYEAWIMDGKLYLFSGIELGPYVDRFAQECEEWLEGKLDYFN